MPKSAGGPPPSSSSAITIHQLHSDTPTFLPQQASSIATTIPSTVIWRGRPSSSPKPFSFQIYLTAPHPPSFAADLLDTLTAQIAPTYERWRLDIYDVTALGWGTEQCLLHYKALELARRGGQELHTVESYFGGEGGGGTSFRGMLFIFDGGDGGKKEEGEREGGMEECEAIVAQFDKGREGRDSVEEACGEEERCGTVVRVSRRRVGSEEGRGTLGSLLEGVWETCEARAEYEGS